MLRSDASRIPRKDAVHTGAIFKARMSTFANGYRVYKDGLRNYSPVMAVPPTSASVNASTPTTTGDNSPLESSSSEDRGSRRSSDDFGSGGGVQNFPVSDLMLRQTKWYFLFLS